MAQAFFLLTSLAEQSILLMAEYTLDITGEVCPMTLVKTKLKLEKLAPGDLLTILVRDGEASRNVPRGLKDHGHEVLEASVLDNGVCSIIVRKDER